MNRVTLENNGFPGTNKTWRFMQEGLRDAIDGITAVLGEKVILSSMGRFLNLLEEHWQPLLL